MSQFDDHIQIYLENYLIEEDWKQKLLSLGLAGLVTFSPSLADAAAKRLKSKPSYSKVQLKDPVANYIAQHEGYRTKIYKDSKGYPTIGIGHLITPNDEKLFKTLFGGNFNYAALMNGSLELTEEQVLRLFSYDVRGKLVLAGKLFPNFNSYGLNTKAAILDGLFRGDLSGSKKTIALINQGKWKEAAVEYLNNREYKLAKSSGSGVATRMDHNAGLFFYYGGT